VVGRGIRGKGFTQKGKAERVLWQF
jgi:hypothetical protein